ncbi:MAG: VIT and VWA domain-containing protein [Rhodoferax sp.]|nr:VIT and VWA domain-containing protein [Rhodoferax sp.]
MNNKANAISFVAKGGQTVALKSVHIDGRLDGLMLSVKVLQSYRNDSGKNLETVYTFPLAWGATLLGMNVELNGKRMQAAVLEKKQATEKYERAIDEGDTPVMVEKSAGGLYTANLGNLLTGEEAVIEIEYAQLLHFEQGRVRLSIPTTIAPRFGDAHRQGGLAAHETDSVNPLVEYPFTLKLDVCGQVAKANLSCLSHKVNIAAMDGGMSVRLEQGAMLDRDFILSLDGLEGQCFAATAPDGDQHAVLASFCPKLPARETSPLLLKILVDCSGSMGGDSIAQARAALHEVFQHLSPADHVSYSKFGSTVEHVVAKMEPCTSRFVGKVLAKALKLTDANLGGTELNQALLSTFEIKAPLNNKQDRNVLLITDGDVWRIDPVVASASKSGHRIFVVGVSSAPAESLLRDLAEKTGGACELVSPYENITNAIVRMFKRMRAAKAVDMQLDWGAKPIWQSALPRQLFDGETVHVFAQLAAPPTAAPSLRWQAQGQRGEARADALGIEALRTVARMAGARRMVEAPSSEEALALALKYQLVSTQTNLILVHVRAEEDKAIGLPALQQVDQMLAAGWGGFGSVRESRILDSAQADLCALQVNYQAIATPSVWRTCVRTDAAAKVDDFEIPAFLRRRTDSYDLPLITPTGLLTPAELLIEFNDVSLKAKNFGEALQVIGIDKVPKNIAKLVQAVTKKAGNRETAWALLLDWLLIQLAGQCALDRHAQRLLRSQLAGVAEDVKLKVAKRFAAELPELCSESWGQVPLTLIENISKGFKKISD